VQICQVSQENNTKGVQEIDVVNNIGPITVQLRGRRFDEVNWTPYWL
jgi:hypothetical protein